MEKVKLIQGNPERAEEIRKTLEECGGTNVYNLTLGQEDTYYYVDQFGLIESMHEIIAKELIAKGKTEIYELPPLQPKCDFKPFDKVLVRDYDDMDWACDFFSNLETDEDKIEDGYIYCTVGGYSRQCIKYEGNEALLGTTNSPR